MWMFLCAYIYICVCVCARVCVHVCAYVCECAWHVHACICVSACMCMHMCVCVTQLLLFGFLQFKPFVITVTNFHLWCLNLGIKLVFFSACSSLFLN